ncbi:uncharacterized protein [Antedon mediterranea]|uniref:uncharacterized protein n=1 Tax=Antedon mediterranea TaxID=105859 RepID=UPI003AF7CC96
MAFMAIASCGHTIRIADNQEELEVKFHSTSEDHLRTAVKVDLGCSSSELVYGATLKLPGQFVAPTDIASHEPANYVHRLQRHMQNIRPVPTRANQRTAQIHDDLRECTHVFVRCDSVKKPLQSPYNGPFKVLNRTDKYFVLSIADKHETVSLDRLKVAYVNNDKAINNFPESSRQPEAVLSSTASTIPVAPPPRQTRSGRHVHCPRKLADYDCG